jgi:hypothetical protein
MEWLLDWVVSFALNFRQSPRVAWICLFTALTMAAFFTILAAGRSFPH